MKTLKKSLMSAVAVAASLSLVVGCGASGGTTSNTGGTNSTTGSQSNNVPITLGYQRTFWGAPVMVSLDESYYKDAGLTVKGVGVSSGKAIRDAVLSGNVDIGAMGSAPFILGASKGDLVAIGVVAYAGKTLAVVAKKGSGITSLAQLKGKKIASQIGSSTDEILVSKVLPSAGLKQGDYQEVNTSFQNMVSALAGGSVQAFAGVEPYVSLAVQKGIGVKLADYGKFDITPLLLVAKKSFVTQHPQEVKEFLSSWNQSIQIFNSDPAKAAAEVQKLFANQGWNASTQTMENALQEMDITSKYVSNLTSYLNNQAETLKSQGKISTIPDWSKVVIQPGSLK